MKTLKTILIAICVVGMIGNLALGLATGSMLSLSIAGSCGFSISVLVNGRFV